VEDIKIRPAQQSDIAQLTPMLDALWPHSSADEHARELRLILGGKASSVVTLPITILVAETSERKLTGFVEVDLRSHADGCDPRQPVGYIEGWYVVDNYRQHGIGKQLVAAAEEWARAHNCVEMASDAIIDNHVSHQAHEALGYEVVDRCVHYRKRL